MGTGLKKEIVLGITDIIFVGLNSLKLRKAKKKKVSPDKLIVVFSHCLQNSKCPEKIALDIYNCKKCGKCVVKDILELSEQYKVRCEAASGGRMALAKIKKASPKVVIAIACEKELKEGIKGIFPKTVVAIPNKRPNGPCKDCQVDPQQVKDALRSLCAS